MNRTLSDAGKMARIAYRLGVRRMTLPAELWDELVRVQETYLGFVTIQTGEPSNHFLLCDVIMERG